MVEFVIFQGFALWELASAIEVFSQFQRLASKPHYAVRVVSSDRLVVSDSGITVAADVLDASLSLPDLFVVVGGAGVADVIGNPAYLALIRARIAMVGRVAAIASGVDVLLQSERATSRQVVIHWQNDRLAEPGYQKLRVNQAILYIQDEWLWTAASASACIDMFLTMLAAEQGADAVRHVAQHMTLTQIRDGNSRQRSPWVETFSGQAAFDRLHIYIQENIRRKLPLEDLAEYCGMSPRNFMRRYLQKIGMTPARAVDKMRAETAAELILQGDRSSKRLVQLCGFGSEETMRRSFVRNFGMSPKEYRRTQLGLGDRQSDA